MATLVLGSLAGALGGQFGTFGAIMGNFAGSLLGQYLSPQPSTHHEGAHLNQLSIQNSVYGQMIPIVYGTIRLAGNIIWASEIKEIPHHHHINYGSKGSGGQSHTQYSYSVSLAIAICEGEINRLVNIWADDELLDAYNFQYRIYYGTQQQEPDHLIEALEGIDRTPAYRGLAYIVLENFPLTAFGNRLPTFSFEIIRKAPAENSALAKPENLVKSITIIPGAGEFVYDTTAQYKQHVDIANNAAVPRGNKICLNRHIDPQKTNATLAVEDLKRTLPQVEWTAPVVSWFASSTDIANCTITPAVEFKDGAVTTPDPWQVAGFTRATATQIFKQGATPIYGGTPSDAGIIRFMQSLKQQGYAIMFYPMLFVNHIDKPWRGRITGDASVVETFFRKKNGYNDFILHYAKLVGAYVDAFVIGSELIGLTSIKQGNRFPAVIQLCHLAKKIKEILPANVKVTYAADWSEYHHTNGGWYNLDELWASPSLDFIGIDAYFPLTECKQEYYDIEAIKNGWQSGEGFDFYFEDAERQIKKPLSAAYAWKNIRWWWENKHINPDGKASAWHPRSKKIWFTEYGFPSVDLASNQPNVFYSQDSIEGGIPRYSQGYPDMQAQRAAIVATEEYWQAQHDMLERLFLWTWDARPYPAWPSLPSIWADAYAWERGHWVQGKLDTAMLSEVCADLCSKVGFKSSQLDLSSLGQALVQGFFINQCMPLRQAFGYLQQAFFFNIREKDAKLQFVDLKQPMFNLLIPTGDLIPITSFNKEHIDIMQIQQKAENQLPQTIELNYIDASKNYTISNVRAQLENVQSHLKQVISLPLVGNPYNARQLAYIMLYAKWYGRTSYSFIMPLQYLALRPLDIINLNLPSAQIRLSKVSLGQNNTVEVEGYTDEPNIYRYSSLVQHSATINDNTTETIIEILDIPALPFEKYNPQTGRALVAACGANQPWQGCNLQIASAEDAAPLAQLNIKQAAIMGLILYPASISSPYLIDHKSRVVVNMQHGKLHSMAEGMQQESTNLALIGHEIIQFKFARLLQKNQYELSHMLRGLYGTEKHISSHFTGERFILLEANLPILELDNNYLHSKLLLSQFPLLEDVKRQVEFDYQGNYHQDYSPVHLRIIRQKNNMVKVSWVKRSKGKNIWPQFSTLNDSEQQLYAVKLYYKNNQQEQFFPTIPELLLPSATLAKASKIGVAQVSAELGPGQEIITTL